MKKKENKVNDFILKLFTLVNNEKTNNIISWNEKGTSFIIHNFKKFCYEILPEVYQTQLYSSFHRQLNYYNFTKMNNDKYEYAHPLFQKGKKELLKDIKRKKLIANLSLKSQGVDKDNIKLLMSKSKEPLIPPEKKEYKDEILNNNINENIDPINQKIEKVRNKMKILKIIKKQKIIFLKK